MNPCQRLREVLAGLNLDDDTPIDGDLLRLLALGASNDAMLLLLLTAHSAAKWLDEPTEATQELVAASGVDWSKAVPLMRQLGRVLQSLTKSP